MKTWISFAIIAVVLAALVVLGRAISAGQSPSVAVSATTKPKQLWHCGMHPQIIQDHPGVCPICGMALTPIDPEAAESDSHQKKILYWWDPMLGPSSISDHPGKSAMGMDLVPVYGDQAGPGVAIDPTVVQNMGVRTALVTRGPLNKTVRTVGMLKIPEPGLHDISLKVGGWIDKLYADQEGMHVDAGEPLFEVYSPDLQVAEQELIAAVKSQRSLGADASAELRQEAQGMIDSAERKLRLWDVAEQDIDAIAKASEPPKDVPFRSPATGHIEDKVIVQGSAVQPMMKLMRVADHTKMWLEAQVYQEQIPVVKIGQEIVATVDGIPGQSWKGTISFIYPHIDHMTRTLTVRMTLDNPDFELKPGMYATAQIITRPIPDAILVPREAVIDTGTQQIAFVAEGEGHFSPRKVKVGLVGDDDQVQIIEGLGPGESVVTSGQFLMDVESRTIEATQKLLMPETTDAATMQPAPSSELMHDAPPAQPSHDTPASMPAVPRMTRPIPNQATTQAEAMRELAVVYCPMAKASWLQMGEAITNPYLGQQMSTCGTVQKKINMPPPNDMLGTLVQSYLDIGKALNANRLDAASLQAIKSTAAKLQGNQYAALRNSADKLAHAKDLAQARSVFRAFSDQLIALFNNAGR